MASGQVEKALQSDRGPLSGQGIASKKMAEEAAQRAAASFARGRREAAEADDPSAAAVAVQPAAPGLEPPADMWFRRRIELVSSLRELWRFRELIFALAERDLKARYKQAFLGAAWSVLTPVALLVVFTLVFKKVAGFQEPGVPRVLFWYIGLLPWMFFSTSLSGGGTSIVSNIPIVNKVYCPREVFPIATMTVAVVDTVISTAVLGILFAATGFAPKVETLYAPLLIGMLVLFTIGATLIISSLLVYLRDLRHVLPLALQLGLFVTPVAYSINFIAQTRLEVLLYSALNPLAPIIDGLRRTVLHGVGPDWPALGVAGATTLLVFVGGYALFKRLETGIADIA
jgi:ABC-type polysaccharide/polyol phosphate export permease